LKDENKNNQAGFAVQAGCWWRAANDLSVGQLDLHDNPLLKKSLTLAHCGEIVVALSVYE
jgi:phosphoketolase